MIDTTYLDLVSFFGTKPPGKILDVPAGEGKLSEELLKKGFTAEEFRHIMRTPFGRLLENEGVVITDELTILRPSR
jgi:hypothetical protein